MISADTDIVFTWESISVAILDQPSSWVTFSIVHEDAPRWAFYNWIHLFLNATGQLPLPLMYFICGLIPSFNVWKISFRHHSHSFYSKYNWKRYLVLKLCSSSKDFPEIIYLQKKKKEQQLTAFSVRVWVHKSMLCKMFAWDTLHHVSFPIFMIWTV